MRFRNGNGRWQDPIASQFWLAKIRTQRSKFPFSPELDSFDYQQELRTIITAMPIPFQLIESRISSTRIHSTPLILSILPFRHLSWNNSNWTDSECSNSTTSSTRIRPDSHSKSPLVPIQYQHEFHYSLWRVGGHFRFSVNSLCSSSHCSTSLVITMKISIRMVSSLVFWLNPVLIIARIPAGIPLATLQFAL